MFNNKRTGFNNAQNELVADITAAVASLLMGQKALSYLIDCTVNKQQLLEDRWSCLAP